MLIDLVLWIGAPRERIPEAFVYVPDIRAQQCEEKSLFGNTNCGTVILYTYLEPSFERKINESNSRK
jgi:hypothetical protein